MVVACTGPLQCCGNITGRLGDSNNLAPNNGNLILVAGDRAARRASPFTTGGDCLSFYRLHCLQCAGDYPDFCASFDLSGLPTPGRSIGDAQHDSERVGSNQRPRSTDWWAAHVGSYVCDLRRGNPSADGALALTISTGAIKCLTHNHNLARRFRRVGSGYPTRRCHIQPTFPQA